MNGKTPCYVSFSPEGLTIASIKGTATYRRVLSWEEIYKIGLRGEKVTGNAVVKQISKQVKKVIDSNVKSMASNKEFLKKFNSRPILIPARAHVLPTPPPAAPTL